MFAADRAVRAGKSSSNQTNGAPATSTEIAAPAGSGLPTLAELGAAPIVVDEAVRRTLTEAFEAERSRPPTDEELAKLIDGWVDEEILFREGLRRGLERDDPKVRERVGGKMLRVLSAGVMLEKPTEAQIRAYFDAHPGKWDRPAYLDFSQVYFQGRDTKARRRAEEAQVLLRTGVDPSGIGDPFAGGHRYRRRELTDLAEAFGPTFVVGLDTEPLDTWALHESTEGFHLVRIERRTKADKANFADVHDEVAGAVENESRERQLRVALDEVRARHRVIVTPLAKAAP